MKTKYMTAEALAGKTLLELKTTWELLSAKHRAAEHTYNRQHASRAATWLPLAISETEIKPGQVVDETVLNEIRKSIPLERVLSVDPEQIGRRARALFLVSVHSVPPEVAPDTGRCQDLTANVKKTANNTKESVVRAIRFFQLLFSSRYGMEETGTWPPAAQGSHFSHGMILYRAIQRAHIREGIFDPGKASPKLALKAAEYYITRATNRRDAGPYHTMRNRLLEALENGLLTPLTPSLLTELPLLKFNTWQGETATLPRAEVVRLWPEHFALDPNQPNRLDYTYGLLGFYNKMCGPVRPLNVYGEKCPSNNLLGEISIFKREEAIRRFLYRGRIADGNAEPKALQDYFVPDNLKDWMGSFLDETGIITTHHKSEHLDITYIAIHYLNIDIEEYDKWLEETGVDFPDSGECMRGTKAVEVAGSPTVFLNWAEAFGMYASSKKSLSIKKSSGFYLPRKSCQIDVLLRAETGLRPGNMDSIEYLTDMPNRNQALAFPSLWKQPNGKYLLAIPPHCMKQHKKRLSGTGRWTTKTKCYEFVIELDETVQALDEYISLGWAHAHAVVKGESKRLFLSRVGKPLRSLQGTFQSMRTKAAESYFKEKGITLPLLDRYSARHVVGEFLNRHMPGGQLKAWYLTHRSGVGSDESYGDNDKRFLRKCVREVLYGTPSLPDQQSQRDDERRIFEQEQSEKMQALVEQSLDQGQQINQLLNLLDRKDEEIRNLRGKSASKR